MGASASILGGHSPPSGCGSLWAVDCRVRHAARSISTVRVILGTSHCLQRVPSVSVWVPAPRHVQSAACLSAYPGAPALRTSTNRVSLLTYVLQTLHRSHPIDGAWRATVHPVPTPAGVTVLSACHVSPTLGRRHASSGDGWAPNLPLPPLIPSTEDYQCNVCSTDPVSVLPGVRPVGRLRRREAETLSFARGRGDCPLHPRSASRMASPYSPDGPPRWVWGFWCPRTVSMQSWTALAMSI